MATIKRLPWKFEGKKHVVRKSEWNEFVADIEKRLVADLNRELEVTNKQLAEALDKVDSLKAQLLEANQTIQVVRKAVKRVNT